MSLKKLVFCTASILILSLFFSCEPGTSLKKGSQETFSPPETEVEPPKPVDIPEKSSASPVHPMAEQGDPTAETQKPGPVNPVKSGGGLKPGSINAQEIMTVATDADIQSLEDRIKTMTDEELSQTIVNLEKAEAEAVQSGKPIPAIPLALSACYGRKGLIDRAYTAIVRAEKAAKAPGIVFSLSAVYGRKELLASSAGITPCAMVLESDPPGALMRVDGIEAGNAPTRSEGLRPGLHRVTADLRGYKPYETSVEGNLGETLKIQAQLKPLPVPYTLRVEPDPAIVKLDDEPLDPGAHKDGFWTGEVLPGLHRVGASLRGYRELGSDILVPLGPEPYQASFRLEPQPSTLTVNSTPAGFSVILDGKNLGVTPLRYQTLDFGEKELGLVSSDWRYKDSVPKKIVLNPGAELSLSQDMEKKLGLFTLPAGPSMPVGAKVLLNGKDMGTVPLIDRALPYGDYNLEIFSPPYEPLVQTIRWNGNSEALPKALKKPYLEVPVRTIKIDGKLDDWMSLDPILTDPAGNDTMPKEPGTDVTALYLARDSKNLYWRIDFADGKPRWSGLALDDDAIQCDLVFNNLTYKAVNGCQLDLRVQMTRTGTYSGYYQIHKMETPLARSENIRYALGPSFLEARIPIASIQPFLGGAKPVRVHVYTGPRKVQTYYMATKTVEVQTDFK